MAPSGTALAITAPVAGTLQAPAAVPAAGATVDARARRCFGWCRFSPSERDAAVDAQQAVETATARRDAAALKVQRAERLVKDGSGSRRALEEAQAELAVAEAELKAARDRVALAGRERGVARRRRHRRARIGHRAERARARRARRSPPAAPLIDLVRLATVWVRVPVYAGEADAIDATAPAQVLTLGETRRRGRRDRPADPRPAVRQSQRPPASICTTRWPTPTPGSGRASGSRCACRAARRETRPGRPEGGAAARRLRRHLGLRRDASRGSTRGSASWSPTSAGRSPCCRRGRRPGARVVTDGAAELFGVEFGAGK